ncbi:MAG: TolC family protein [Aquificaceae bacterium]|nr:TolC family protein [Aquificaceae bacterium]
MRTWLLALLSFCVVFGRELTLRESMELALKNSPLIRSAQREAKAQELQVRAARGALFPKVKLEENFTLGDVPAYAFVSKLNQERVSQQDFNPLKLNSPSSVSNFETKLTLEVPLWLGGRVQSSRKIAEHQHRASLLEAERRQEEVLKQVYQAYAEAATAKRALQVSRQAVEEAREHYRLAEQMHRAGVALLSDVLRAKVHLSKAEEHLERAKKDYQIAKRGLELAVGTALGEFEVVDLGECPSVNFKGLAERALQRKDLRALEERIKVLQESYRLVLSDTLPQVFAFAQYVLNSRDYPLGAQGSGYLLGVSLSWSFETGFSTLRRAQANLERKAGLEERLKLLRDSAVFEVERAYADYEKSMLTLRSAQDRIKASQEVLRVVEVRYRNGLARMVDLLDAQVELDRARFEKVQAVNACHKAYAELLFNAGLTQEVLK